MNKTGIVFLCAASIFSAGIPSPGLAEKILCKDGKVFEGEIIHVDKGTVWIKRESGDKGIGIKLIDKILNDDGSVSKYDYKSLLDSIQEDIKNKRYKEAKELSSSLLQYVGDNARLRYLRAVLNQKTGDIEGAAEDYTFLLEHKSADAKVYNNLGTIYASKQDFRKAIDLYQKAIEGNPGEVQAHNNLADVCMQTGDFSRAFEEYKKVVDLEPQNGRAWYNLGILYLKNHDIAKARESWEKVLSLKPDDLEAKRALQQLMDKKI